jgi:hypothetical protein
LRGFSPSGWIGQKMTTGYFIYKSVVCMTIIQPGLKNRRNSPSLLGFSAAVHTFLKKRAASGLSHGFF